MGYAIGKREFGKLVEKVLKELPPTYAEALENVRVEVMTRPTPRMLRQTRVGRGQTLLGLYQGRPRTRRSVEDSAYLPDMIFVFQRELEAACESEADLEVEIKKTLLHEFGHHFGLEEGDLDGLGYG